MARHKQWFPFDVGLYIKNTSRLTTHQHGAYLLLMLSYWEEGPIPNDGNVLALICRCNADAMHDVLHVLKNHFRLVDGSWHHDYLDSLKTDQHAKYLKRKEAAEKRWSNANADAHAMHEQGASVSVSKESISQSEEKSKASKATRFVQFWSACPKRGGASNPKKPAKDKYATLVRKGMSEAELIQHAHAWRLRDEKTGVAGTPLTAQVSTWLSQRRWEDHDDEAPDMEKVYGVWRERVDAWRRDRGTWKTFYGPEPGQPGCLVPDVLLSDMPAPPPFLKR